MNIDWDEVFFAAQQAQPKIVQDIRSFVLYTIAPQACHFTGKELEGSCFAVMLQIKRKTFALLCDKEYYVLNHGRIKNFLMIHQDYYMEPIVCYVVESVPNFANYRPWLTPQVSFVNGSLKDVDMSKSTTTDRTRLAGREEMDPDFAQLSSQIVEERIAQLDYKPTPQEAFSLLDEIRDAKPIRQGQLLLEVKHE